MWATHPLSASSGYHAEFHEVCYQKHTNPLNCRTSSSDISGYHADFHKGYGTVGERQGHCMVYVELTRHGVVGTRHGHGMICELAFRSPETGTCQNIDELDGL
jgi:hypothetical protein